ncbi:hypothetical protein [Metamycoplasma cloacale]|uniref:Uncharacterized protein n=1 Tax=Metamycoplasma cloacale TaxID=92401 RepID=A0A2Z4LN36_9BACT|nr:hypothetical protein [Metamycoplasma cloacale]AWX42994.1 hypothetical protein DK849_00005 [Metamycoplasma cloacale]
MQRKDIQELFDIAWINTIDEKLTRNSDSNKRFDLSNEENRKLLSYLLKRYSIFSIFSNGGLVINNKLIISWISTSNFQNKGLIKKIIISGCISYLKLLYNSIPFN